MLQYCFCFMFWYFGCKACGILALSPGIKPATPKLEVKVLTTGPLGKPPEVFTSNLWLVSLHPFKQIFAYPRSWWYSSMFSSSLLFYFSYYIHNPFGSDFYILCKVEIKIYFFRGDLQDGGGVRCGDRLPPHKYIRNTSTCGTTPTEHLLNAGRRP